MVKGLMVEINQKELEVALQPIRDTLNLKLVMADLREYKMQGCGEIMIPLDKMLDVFTKFELSYFEQAVRFINDLLAEVVMESISHYTGMSYVLNLYELLEDAVDDFISGKDVFKEFDKTLRRFQQMFSGVAAKVQDQPDTFRNVIQNMPPQDIMEDGLISEFINEVQEGLEEVEVNLLELEQEPGKIDLINLIFRVMHTVKGTAGFLGMPVIGSVAHKTEDILSEVRDQNHQVDKSIITLLFAAVDTLKNLLEQLKVLISGVDPEPVDMVNFFEALDICKGQKDNDDSMKASKIVEEVPPKVEAPIEPKKIAEPPPEKLTTIPSEPNKDQKKKISETKSSLSPVSKFTEMLKVPAEKLDELSGLVGEMVVALSILVQNKTISKIHDRDVRTQLDHLVKITENLRDKVLGVRMFPIGSVFSKLKRQVRDLSQKSGKEINLVTFGEETLVDKSVIDSIYAPLMHLVRNSIDHGIEVKEDRIKKGKDEKGNVVLKALSSGDAITIIIEDDGKGLDKELILTKAIDRGLAKAGTSFTDRQIYSFIFLPGFSTAKTITDISGRGVGLDVVTRTVDDLRGKITIDSKPGEGSSFILTLPITSSIIEGLVVSVGVSRFVLPILDVDQTLTPKAKMLKGVQGKEGEMFLLAGELIPIVRLYELFKIAAKVKEPTESVIVVVNDGHKKFGLMVDELLHRQQIVLQNLGKRFSELHGVSGGTILGDGRVGLILDPKSLIQTLHLNKEKTIIKK